MARARMLRVAVVCPLLVEVPPKKYGGIELMAGVLVEVLRSMGHHVVLYAAGGSTAKASKTVFGSEKPLWEYDPRLPPRTAKALHYAMYEQVLADADNFDLILLNTEDHLRDRTLHANLHALGKKVLTIMHGPSSRPSKTWMELASQSNLVSISLAQRMALNAWMLKTERGSNSPWVGNVYHGLVPKLYPLPRKHGDYLLFLGRMHKTKGAHLAVEIARQAGKKLIIAARIHPGEEQEYYDRAIAPHVDGENVVYFGEANHSQKTKLLNRAIALVFPIQWPEPFGLVMIEAMACGCPVIAFNHGSVAEVVANGETGFIVNRVRDAAHAVPLAGLLDRHTIREAFIRKFSATQMAKGYSLIHKRSHRRKKSK